MRRAARAAAWVLALAATPAPAAAGVVCSRDGVLLGRISLQAGRVRAGDRAVDPKDVLVAVFDPAGRPLPAPNAVRWRDGQVWTGEITGLAGGKLSIRSPWFGRRTVPADGVASLDFQAGLGPGAGLADESLHRRTGRPLPGALLWISETKIAVDSPLGAMALDREQASRYLPKRAAPVAAPPPAGEVVLHDGTVLHGAWSVGNGAVTITHTVLGTLSVPPAAVRALRRREAGVAYLADSTLRASGRSVLPAEAADLVRPCSPGAIEMDGRACLRAVRIEAGGRIDVPPAGAGAGRRLRGVVWPVAGATAAARLRVRSGAKVLLERQVEPGAAGAAVDLALPAGVAVTLDVASTGPVRYPCGVVLGDAHLTWPVGTGAGNK